MGMIKNLNLMTLDALDRVGSIFDTYLVFPSAEARDAVVLWTLHAHVFKAFESTPRLSVRSTEPGSGKSRVLELLEHMTPKPLVGVDVAPAVLWRSIEAGPPTLLLDEIDTVFGKAGSASAHRTLRGILNAGHRSSSVVPRCVGTEDVKYFHVFAPVALAGLGRLPDTLATRSVEIVMRKRRKGDPPVQPFRLKFAEDALKAAFELCEEWGNYAFPHLSVAMPDLPVQDRPADVWEPLITIADLAGEEWSKRARTAAVELTKQAADKPISPGVRLLTDLRAIMAADMLTADILGALYRRDESVWTRDNMDAKKLARLLNEYGVKPVSMRMNGAVNRGYKLSALEDAFTTYLPAVKVGGDDGEA